jgi:hypothetical protein
MARTYSWDRSAASAGRDASQIHPELECSGLCPTLVCPLAHVSTRNRQILSASLASNRYGVPNGRMALPRLTDGKQGTCDQNRDPGTPGERTRGSGDDLRRSTVGL